MKGLETRFERNENFVFRRIGDETILVPIKSNIGDMGSIYNLNPVGSLVWELLDGEKPLRCIKNMILETFDVTPQEAEEDLCDFLNQLKEIGAVVERT